MARNIGAYQHVSPDIGAYEITPAAPAGAVMSQFQGPNLGADLYNGTLVGALAWVLMFFEGIGMR